MRGSLENKKVAIVHDWLIGGGAERVVYELHRMFPDAPIYTSYCGSEWREKLDGKVVTGYLQRWPFPLLRKFLPVLRTRWFGGLDLSEFDVVISSTGNGEAKHIRVPEKTLHICYCHTPVHFYWRHFDLYMKNPGFGMFNWLARYGLKILVRPLRKKDYSAAQTPDYFIANSHHIKDDIKKYYGREAEVVFPPIDTERFQNARPAPGGKRQGFLYVGRQVPQKRIDIIVKACSELNLPLKVVGSGPEHNRLLKLAGPSVSLLGYLPDEKIPDHMARAEAFIFASEDDFGIAPLEAMACGTPVIAYKYGGALDYVVPGKTGEFFAEQTPESLIAALKHFNSRDYSADDIKMHAQKFSNESFQKNLSILLDSVVK